MKTQSFSDETFQKLHEFESIENIELSESWNESLFERLSNTTPIGRSGFSTLQYVMLIAFALLNLGLIFNLVRQRQHTTSSHGKELELISSEFLINPSNLNN
jgi:hypothetical protein